MNEIELWVARDKDGKIYLYRDRPIKDKFVWYSPGFNLLLASACIPSPCGTDTAQGRGISCKRIILE